jgi:thiol-disulfide isomerase/thioredoxin
MIRPLLLASLLLLGCSPQQADQMNTVYTLSSETATDFEQIDLRQPHKLVLINYWAIWCAPCRKEVPELNELMHEQADKLLVVGVNFDQAEGEKLASEVKRLGIEFPSLLIAPEQQDPRTLWNLPPVTVLPETLIIDAQGNLQQRLIGPQDKASLQKLLQL